MAHDRPPATPLSATPFDEAPPPIPEDLLSQGKAIMKAGTPFVTAMSVQRPRDLGKIVQAMKTEAQYAGDSFYYQLPFGDQVEGPSIGLAVSLARAWGNCAVTMDVQETPDAYMFTGRFIDLETGYQLDRAFRQRKAGAVHGKFDSDRKLDMAFQIGQSKAIRNVILNATPRWLQDQMVEVAKAAVAAGIKPGDLLAEREKIGREFSEKFRVTPEQLTAKIGRGAPDWTAADIATLRGIFKALVTKDLSVEEAFGSDPARKPEAPAGPVKDVGAKPATSSVETPQAGATKLPPPAATAEPSAEEAERDRLREEQNAFPFRCTKCLLFGAKTEKEVADHVAKDHPAGPAKPQRRGF